MPIVLTAGAIAAALGITAALSGTAVGLGAWAINKNKRNSNTATTSSYSSGLSLGDFLLPAAIGVGGLMLFKFMKSRGSASSGADSSLVENESDDDEINIIIVNDDEEDF